MKSDILPITASVKVGSLGTVNADGSPWSTPLHFAIDENKIVWLSTDNAQHSRNIDREPRVSIVLWSDTEVENVKGIYVQSQARKVTGMEEVAARQLYAARFGGIPEKFVPASTYIAPLGAINTTMTRGGRLYFNG